MSSEGKCRSCGALVLWVTMVGEDGKSGRLSPLDAVPVLVGGTVERRRGLHSDTWYGRVVPRDERDAKGPLYRSHFATCPDAAKHRRLRAIHEDGGR